MPVIIPSGNGFVLLPDTEVEAIMLDLNGVRVGLHQADLTCGINSAGMIGGKCHIISDTNRFYIDDFFVVYPDLEGWNPITPLKNGSCVCEGYEELALVDIEGNAKPLALPFHHDPLGAKWPSAYWLYRTHDERVQLMNHLDPICFLDFADVDGVTHIFESGEFIFSLYYRECLMIHDKNGVYRGKILLPKGCTMIQNIQCNAKGTIITGNFAKPYQMFVGFADWVSFDWVEIYRGNYEDCATSSDGTTVMTSSLAIINCCL